MGQLLLQMLGATLTSLKIFVLTLAFALPLGILIAKGRMSKNRLVSNLVNIYIMIMRGTPLILQLIFVYFAPYYVFGTSYDRFTAVIVGFVINYAAYFAEIYRGGIQAIPRGQYEASHVLGFSKAHTFTHIVAPQVVKRIIPAMGNEVITLVKDTALAQTIGVAELFRVAQNASARQFSTMPIFIAGVFYFLMNGIVSRLFDRLERKLNYYN
ncbi:amine acid ABC transporter, permease protein, 3-TM region, His/Glu/Gln/Arg/opine family [Sphaerochaeta pleomorpha str. Grapes]|uniref:Amine acid ABC transporter, permease protein, 3-TM region, His/Glu/Gln/Arg/opine family n=1 Tax=Sphaerochaeta pleomorpha (strain ATCC BAA-1885 / DSM 22778 / Grapes) TaxID=158190 RepID=G8QRU5_SPHPG|nr:amino acid ABC transporter permease [Sphaerochaeta pleomorpha]AEV28878.1 amine acid ABC transporter, permease protein, 3-TM region, His/Glu/Gln/Arg/opine family [Sphaerochaeta pleomorpha str. Grapes]